MFCGRATYRRPPLDVLCIFKLEAPLLYKDYYASNAWQDALEMHHAALRELGKQPRVLDCVALFPSTLAGVYWL